MHATHAYNILPLADGERRWQAASKLANRLGLLSKGPGKARKAGKAGTQRKQHDGGISSSIRKVSSRLHRHRHSESLMTSYLRMQAATAEPEVATGRQLNRQPVSQQATAETGLATGREQNECHIDTQPTAGPEVARGAHLVRCTVEGVHGQEGGDGHSLQVSADIQASRVEREDRQARPDGQSRNAGEQQHPTASYSSVLEIVPEYEHLVDRRWHKHYEQKVSTIFRLQDGVLFQGNRQARREAETQSSKRAKQEHGQSSQCCCYADQQF